MKYYRHSIALTEAEEIEYQEVKAKTGKGITAIFKDMLNTLKTTLKTVQQEE